MATILENAAKGRRKAMMQLYESKKTVVYVTAELLLGNSEQAVDVAASVFGSAWTTLSETPSMTDVQFTEWILCQTVEACKRRVVSQNSKAYRLPSDRSFVLSDLHPSTEKTEDYEEFVLQQLPPLHKLILILHTVCGFTPSSVAKLVKLDTKTCDRALADEQTNVAQLLAGTDHTYEQLLETLTKKTDYVIVPSALDTQVAQSIGVIADPLEKKKRNNILVGIGIGVLCLAFAVAVFFGTRSALTYTDGNSTTSGDSDTDTTTDTDTSSDLITEPVIKLDDSLTYSAIIDIKDYGKITVELDPETAPVTVSNFVKLAQDGFYDGLTFHRIIEGFMMQGGDPQGDGLGGSSQNIVGEFSENGHKNDIKHKRGVISMARSNSYDSASSQFFIMHEDSEALDGQYAAFGHVTEGLDVVDAVCETAEPTDGNGTIPADKQPVINSITITTAKK